jgi:hypothetical protein
MQLLQTLMVKTSFEPFGFILIFSNLDSLSILTPPKNSVYPILVIIFIFFVFFIHRLALKNGSLRFVARFVGWFTFWYGSL